MVNLIIINISCKNILIAPIIVLNFLMKEIKINVDLQYFSTHITFY